jgi:hypothetical protein
LEFPNTLHTFANTQTAAHCDMRRELQNKKPLERIDGLPTSPRASFVERHKINVLF